MTGPKFCDFEQCREPATHTYVWAWGESGFCCAPHQMMRTQQASQLKRQIQFTALTPGAPERVTFDERVRLHAEAISAREECAEVKGRSAELYSSNQKLAAEVRRQQLVLSQLQSEVADLRAELEQVTREKLEALRQVANLTNEVARAESVLRASGLDSAPFGAG